ncbi:hypothetical protein HZH66_003562 [Vespula vulgaris]|uniref:Uncharacterized protein n=1 Tax=Vespula vulgaris TaxID=7454 RepID=A0A834KIH5_VESVU|nr:hypothetical protein HZH66_003562 [Vespula vulgaris]
MDPLPGFNILKINKADDYLFCDEINKIKLSSITNETITTYGSCIFDMCGHLVEFHIVPYSFPNLHSDDAIYAGETIVSNMNGQANIKILTTNEKEARITIPAVRLEEFETADGHDASRPRDVINKDIRPESASPRNCLMFLVVFGNFFTAFIYPGFLLRMLHLSGCSFKSAFLSLSDSFLNFVTCSIILNSSGAEMWMANFLTQTAFM